LRGKDFFEKINGKVIVSCQALPDEPLHSPFIMKRMAYAAMLGGASGIRANGIEDIIEIKSKVDLPIIGIIKEFYSDCDVFITPTMKEVDALYNEGVDVIAMDATDRIRPNGETIVELFPQIRKKYPNQLFMADCSTYEEAIVANELGFDCVATTLSHLRNNSEKNTPDFQMIKKLSNECSVPVIAEGGIETPEQLKKVFSLGVHAAVIGGAITRPMEITKRFIKAIQD